MSLQLKTLLSSLTLGSLLTACGHVGLDQLGEEPDVVGTTELSEVAPQAKATPSELIAPTSSPLKETSVDEPLDSDGVVNETEEAESMGFEEAEQLFTSSEKLKEAQDLEAAWFSVGFEELESDVGIYNTLNASLALSEDEVLFGESALKASQGDLYSQARLIHKVPRVRSSDIYFRGWLYVPEGSVTGKVKLVSFRSSSSDGIDVNVNANQRFDVFHHDTLQRSWSPIVFEEGSWSCLQVSIFAHPYLGSYEVSLNQELILEATDTDTQPGPIDYVEFGLLWSEEGQEGGSIYWDEVASSDSPIPCEYDD